MDYSLVITTNARPFCLERLLTSLVHLREQPTEIIVGDSTHSDAPRWVKAWYAKIFDMPSVTTFQLASNCPPSIARRYLLGKVRMGHVLLIDDDVVFGKDSHKIMDPPTLHEFDVIGGTWLQWQASNYSDSIDEAEATALMCKDIVPPANLAAICGFQYAYGRTAEGHQAVVKNPLIAPQDLDCIIPISDVMPTLFAKIEVFEKINFDDRFLYFFEWYDFSMQARQAEIKLFVRTGAHFYHLPEKYAYRAAGFHYPRADDMARFVEKWQTVPLFAQ